MKSIMNNLPTFLFVALLLAVVNVLIDQSQNLPTAASFQEEELIEDIASPSLETGAAAAPRRAEATNIDKTLVGTVDLAWGASGTYTETWTADELSELTEDASIDIGFLLVEASGNAVTAYVDLESTLVYTNAHIITTTVNATGAETLAVGPQSSGSYTNDQLNLLSERIVYTTEAGQTVERQFRLSAAASTENGILTGEYRETIWGITLDPLTIMGTFELREVEDLGIDQPSAIPQTQPDRATVDAGESVTIDVLVNDAALEGTLDPSSVEILQPPAKGTATVDPITGVVTYTASESSAGTDTFTYIVKDSRDVLSTIGTVTIEIKALGNSDIYLPMVRLDQ